MKVTRYFAADIRSGLRQVRHEMGPDAVILSTNPCHGGIEIVAAIDYDETAFKKVEPTSTGAATHEESTQRAYSRSNSGAANAKPRRTNANGERQGVAQQAGEKVIWSQDPVLVEMRAEIKTLRGMLEHQLSGLAWGDLVQRHPLRSELFQRLLKLGLSVAHCQRLLRYIDENADVDSNWRLMLEQLVAQIGSSDDDIIQRAGVVALVGPTGVGKTTTLAKLAARYVLKNGARRVALITTDNYRIGAHEQIRTYGRILGVPVRVVGDSKELSSALRELSGKSLVLIDTAGMGQRDMRLVEQFNRLQESAREIRSYLVLSATTMHSALDEIVSGFAPVRPSGCVLTKLDEATNLGGLLSTLANTGLPLAYMCDGQRVPEDIHLARPHSLVSQALDLMEAANRILDEESLALTNGRALANA